MLQLDVVRGKDSTGIAAVTTTGDVLSAKEAWLPQDFLDSRGAKKIFERTSLRCLIGHNRAATVGAVNKAGAHPFEFDNLIGVHNGTTSKHMFDNSADFTVDSEALYHHANKNDIDSAWENLTGAASLAYYSKADKTLNLLRNDQRPMTYAVSTDGKTLFFASEVWMILVACDKAGIDIGTVYKTAENNLYTFDMDTHGADMSEYTKRFVKPYVKPTYNGGSALRSGFHNKKIYHINEQVEFEFESIVTAGQNKVAHIITVGEKAGIKGRIYLDPADCTQNKLFGSSTNLFSGVVRSSMVVSNVQTITIDRSSVTEIIEGNVDSDLDAIIFAGNSKPYTREEFNAAKGINNCCSWCGNPVDFDNLDFKGAGKSGGLQEVVCDACEAAYEEDILMYTDLQDVSIHNPL